MIFPPDFVAGVDLKQFYLKANEFLRPHQVSSRVIPFQVRTLSVYIPMRYREDAKRSNNYRDLGATVCLLEMKYSGECAEENQAFWSMVLNASLDQNYDDTWMICAVPSAKAYKQTHLHTLAAEAAKYTGMEDGSHLVTRHGTIPRSNDTRRQRYNKVNHLNSIHVSPDVAGRKILLLDDIVTTGTTLCAMGQMLLEAGATEVKAITLAETCCARG